MRTGKLIFVAFVSALTGAAVMGALTLWYFDPFNANESEEVGYDAGEADEVEQIGSVQYNFDRSGTAAGPVVQAGDRDAPRSSYSGPLLPLPVQGAKRSELIDSFGDERGGGTRSHEGIDIMAPSGTPVIAITDARISDIFDSEAGGLTMTLKDERASYFYGHLSAYLPGLKEGMSVKQGQILGYVGSTGNADPANPHLHFEMRLTSSGQSWNEGRIVNPYDYLRAR